MLRVAAVGGITEPFIARTGSRVAFFDAQFGLGKAAGADPLPGGLDEEGADPALLQRPVDGELPQVPGRQVADH